jgi:hypothetical protein
MHDSEDMADLQINYDKIIADRTMLSVTRLLAAHLCYNPYMTVGDFVKSLSDTDLDILMDVAEGIDKEDFEDAPRLEEMVLITEMLVRAEGLVTVDSSVLTNRVNALCMFLACEGLFRKGMVKLYHNHMSFGEDMGQKILVEKIEGVDYDDYS